MIVTAWIIFIVFGFFTLILFLGMFSKKKSGVSYLSFVAIYTLVTAISAGVLFGGLVL